MLNCPNDCVPQPECTINEDCDDLNSCTYDLCSAGSCVNPVMVSSPCDDGIECTGNDVCAFDGSCISSNLNHNLCTEKSNCQSECTQKGCSYYECLHEQWIEPPTKDIGLSPTFTYEYLTFADLFKIRG